jgi:hypothetical protein
MPVLILMRGQMNCFRTVLCVMQPEELFPNAEICVAVLYNYLTDYKLWKDNTKPLQRPLVELKSVDDYKDYMKYLEGDIPVYTGDELKTIISVYKTNVTWDDINALTQDSSLESVKKTACRFI